LARVKKKDLQSQSDRNIPTELVRNLDSEGNAAYEMAWRNSTYVTDRIKEAIEKRIEALELDLPSDYSNPSWAYLRADKNGRVAALTEILKLLP
jgi:hypothetical protein